MKQTIITIMIALVAVTGQAQNTFEGHEYVDLGLPSGTLWATCNVGANSPEEYGEYFAWGETKPKKNFRHETYQYDKDRPFTSTKYCADSKFGYNGCYWSRSLYTINCNYACSLSFDSDDIQWDRDARDFGQSVRPVRKQ
ncbi:MAG: hypothetical protein J6V92_06740 [Bacteroidaceae bacterium]|nr:hypothetical protein [Bacteroidaceae bacterium]